MSHDNIQPQAVFHSIQHFSNLTVVCHVFWLTWVYTTSFTLHVQFTLSASRKPIRKFFFEKITSVLYILKKSQTTTNKTALIVNWLKHINPKQVKCFILSPQAPSLPKVRLSLNPEPRPTISGGLGSTDTAHLPMQRLIDLLHSLMIDRYGVHDDVIKRKHFPRYWSFVRGIHRSPMNSPHKGQWRGALMFSLISPWTNGYRDAGELRRYRAHYDVTVMGGESCVDVWHSNLSILLPGDRCYELQNGCQTNHWSAWEHVVLVGLKSCCITVDEKVEIIVRVKTTSHPLQNCLLLFASVGNLKICV